MRTTLPCRAAAARGGELSHPVPPARDGIVPSTGMAPRTSSGAATALAAAIARTSAWLGFMARTLRIVDGSSRVDVDHRLGKRGGRLLGQVVPDAAFDQAMRVLAREFLRIRS